MDPLSITASIIALLQLTRSVLDYLKDFKDASEDRFRLMGELSGLKCLLSLLETRVNESKAGDPWLDNTVRVLDDPNGLLDQFKSDLARLASKPGGGGAVKAFVKKMTWSFEKTEIKDLLSKIERVKTLVLLALANDHL